MREFTNPHVIDGESVWKRTAAEFNPAPKLKGCQHAEYAIVGAGVAGLSAALTLSEAGHDCVVLEAETPGCGAAGKSGGIIAPDFIKHTPDDIETMFGENLGQKIVNLVGGAGRYTRQLIERNHLSCDYSGGFAIPAHNPALSKILANKAHQWQRRCFNVREINAAEASDYFGSEKYISGIEFVDGGQLNPLALCQELARVVMERKGAVSCHSPVASVSRENGKWALRTRDAKVLSNKVILASNGGNSRLHPKLHNTTLPLHVYEFATRPLSAEERSKVLSGNCTFTDKQPYLFTARFDRDGRLVSAFPANYLVRGFKQRLKEAKRRIGVHYPALQNVDIEYIWKGTAWLNTSLLPAVYKVEDNMIAIQSCNGRGLANNLAIGAEVGRYMSQQGGDVSLPFSDPEPIPWYFFAQYAPASLMSWAYMKDRLIASR